MKRLRMNRKGQFSIIASLFVAVILISSVMVTYSTIRYNTSVAQPQIMNAIDETNLALKQVLGFTVGYYGSILQVTGNSSYAYAQSEAYLNSGLNNIADINPGWGSSFNISTLSLGTDWFTNSSYSQGELNVTYNLLGLGVYGIAYSISSELSVQVQHSSSSNQVSVTVTQDGNQPVVTLGTSNFKFYLYQDSNLTWGMVYPPDDPVVSSDGTYTLDIPKGINPQSFIIQVQDSRGIMVAASSFSHYTGTLTFNSTTVSGGDYVNHYNSSIDGVPDEGIHSNFSAQQSAPDGVYDSLTEANIGTQVQNCYPTSYNSIGGTSLVSGGLGNLQTNNGNYMKFNSYPSGFSSSSTFGYSSIGASTQSTENTIVGSVFTVPTNAVAQNITAHIQAAAAQTFGYTSTSSSTASIMNTIRGSQFAPTYNGVATSITAYIGCSSYAKNMEAAIYNNADNSLVAATNQQSVSPGTGWVTFTFSSGPSLVAGNTYILVVWAASGSGGNANLYYKSVSTNQGDSYSQPYGAWPAQPPFTTGKYEYDIYCTYQPTAQVKAAIYSSANALIAGTQQATVSATGWVTFSFSSPLPTLAANTNYILVVWSTSGGGFTLSYSAGSSNQGQSFSQTYGSWPASPNFSHNTNKYSIYCGYSVPSQYCCAVEFLGSSNAFNWNNLYWAIDGSSSVSSSVTLQLMNYNTGLYPTSGDGYMKGTFGTANNTEPQTITSNPANFRDNIGNWNLSVTVTASVSSPFTVSLNLARYAPGQAVYGLNLEEQWTNLNTTTLLHPALCIYAGNVASSNLAVYAWYDNTWHPLSSGLVNGWNNMSINSFLAAGSTTFTIRFAAANGNVNNTWQVASALIRPESNQDLFNSLTNPAATVAVELLQNGTMIWLGQNLQVTTQTIPVPPVPVKAIHVNETINGVNRQVPFQIEDWASSYTVPLGLTNNATVFGNRQMVVFLVNTHVSAFTLWWNGSSQAVQTPLAYTDKYFTNDNPSSGLLTNGKLSVQFSGSFTATSTVLDTGTQSQTTFMKINGQNSDYGSGVDYVIYRGVVRDIVQQEAEWDNGVSGCPNLYADCVLTLPANATYFTYQLSLMFLSSTQTRTISQLCPISITSTINQLQTENGTSRGDPVVASGTQLFNATQTWVHHWSQFISGSSGAGIMFTDAFNHGLYVFDSMTPVAARGALSANSASPPTISLLPVTLNSVTFQNALDVSWYGAVVTFDASVLPIYNGTQPGLWVLAEMPPSVNVTCGN